jgi:hypothetical protein
MRAADWWDSAPFLGIFLASGFSCSQAESQPAHQPLTPTVGQPKSKCKVVFDSQIWFSVEFKNSKSVF